MMKQLISNSYLFGANTPYIEELYENYLTNPTAIDSAWRDYFDKLAHLPGAGNYVGPDVAHQPEVLLLRVVAGHRHDLERRPEGRLGEFVGHPEPRLAGHVEVEHDHLHGLHTEHFDGSQSGAGFGEGRAAQRSERSADHSSNRRRVVNNQDGVHQA